MDACLKEIMRLYPPCPFLARYCNEDTIIGENISVEKGTVVMWFNTYFHMHPDLYDNPKGTSLPIESFGSRREYDPKTQSIPSFCGMYTIY